jgi:hypothetical protein
MRWLIPAVLAACSAGAPREPRGQVVVAVTIDWEGAYLSADGLDALDAFRGAYPAVPLTHFVSAGYFTKPTVDPATSDTLTQATSGHGDEVALHLHLWASLARAANVTPKLSPSFFTGTDKRVDIGDGDAGFDTDPDAYTSGELRAMIRTSRALLAKAGLRPTPVFRAGGFLGTPRLLQALHDEQFVADSSAIAARQVEEAAGEILADRIDELWPSIEVTSQPYSIPLHGGPLLELPVASYADYQSMEDIAALLDDASARLAKHPDTDVYLVLGFHQETAAEFVDRLDRALEGWLAKPGVAATVTFATIEQIAARVRAR